MTDGRDTVKSIVKRRDKRHHGSMKPAHRIITAGLSALTLTSCVPLDTYYKAGTSVSRMERDLTTCDVRALRDAPVATQLQRGAPIFVPPERFCDSNGNCRVYPGYWEPGPLYTVDVNADLRARVQMQCMMDRGYVEVSLPSCPSKVANATPPARTTVFPKLTENACVIRNSDKSWQIVP